MSEPAQAEMRSEGTWRRRPEWAQTPPQQSLPKPQQAPANPFAFKNRHQGKGFDDDWASPSQDAEGVDPVKKGWVGRSGESGEFTAKGSGGTKKSWSETHAEKSQAERGRSLKGGEVALTNKEHYKGGQFLPSTDRPKGQREKALQRLVERGPPREASEPGKLEEPPSPLHRAIFDSISLYVRPTGEGREYLDIPYARRHEAKEMGAQFDWSKKQWYLEKQGEADKFELKPDILFNNYEPVTRESDMTPGVVGIRSTEKQTMGDLIDRYNRGERWIEVKLPPDIDIPEDLQQKLRKRSRRFAAEDEAMGNWQSPSQALDWANEWRPPGWNSPAQDFSEADVKRDDDGKFSSTGGGGGFREQVDKAVAKENYGEPSAVKRGNNPRFPYIGILKTPDSRQQTRNPLGRRAYATREEAIAAVNEYVDAERENLRKKLLDRGHRALRRSYGLPSELPTQDADPFSEDKVNRDNAGKFSHQRQLHHARDRHWRSPRQDEPPPSERNLIEDARIKAYDMAQRLMGRDAHPAMRIASDRRLMAFDHALVRGALKSQVMRLAFDSVRSFSADGHMHVGRSRISRASVNPYLGAEIPGSEELGLLPKQKYQLLRHPDELAKAAASFNGIPILIDHRPISADDHPSNLVVGSTGDSARWEPPFLTNSLHIWDQNAIDAITSNERRELSCAYHYDPVMQPGVYEGKPYDGIMTNIHGNHVALVPDGRVGPAAVVADAMPFDLLISDFFAT